MPIADYRAQKLKTRNKDRLITQPEKKPTKQMQRKSVEWGTPSRLAFP